MSRLLGIWHERRATGDAWLSSQALRRDGAALERRLEEHMEELPWCQVCTQALFSLLPEFRPTSIAHVKGGVYYDYYDEQRDKLWRAPVVYGNSTSSSYDTGDIKQLPWYDSSKRPRNIFARRLDTNPNGEDTPPNMAMMVSCKSTYQTSCAAHDYQTSNVRRLSEAYYFANRQ